MKHFDVYSHPIRGFQAVPEGFSWGAAFFGPGWCLIRGMYAYALSVLVIVTIVFMFMEDLAGDFTRVIVALVVGVFLGIHGNDLRRRILRKRGFRHLGRFESLAEGNAVEDAQNMTAGTVTHETVQR